MLVTWASTLGAGVILLKLVEAVIKRFTGKQQREQNAWQQRDQEARSRRMLEEYAAVLRRKLISMGVKVEELPPWPRYVKTGEPYDEDY